MKKRGTNAPLQPDAVPNALQTSILTRLNGAPHGLTARGAGTRPDVLWRMERAGWVKVVPRSAGYAWRPTDAGRAALGRAPVRVIVWRAVITSQPRSGRGSVLGPDTTRRARWWVLTLECKHVVERTARYKPPDNPQRRSTQHRDSWDLLPPSAHVRCAECAAELQKANQEGATR